MQGSSTDSSPLCPTADFAVEIIGSTKFFLDRWRNRPGTSVPRNTVTDRNGKHRPKKNFEEAFGFAGYDAKDPEDDEAAGMRMRGGSDEENIRLAPYASGKYRPRVHGGGGVVGRGPNGYGSGSLCASEEDQSAGLSPYTSHGSELTGEYIEPVHVHEGKRGSGGLIGTAI